MQARLGAPFGHVMVQLDAKRRVEQVRLSPEPRQDHVPRGFPDEIVATFEAYWAGAMDRPRVPVGGPEGTAFQRQVWAALVEIVPGDPLTYGELAERIDRAGAARAVGQALAANPLPLVWPCHRVTSRRGLGGYGGCSEGSGDARLNIKRWLLDHEASMATSRVSGGEQKQR